MQDFGAKMARDDRVTLDDIGVVGRAFSDGAVLYHPRIVTARSLGHHFAHGRIQQLHGFNIATAPALIVDRDDFDADLGDGIVSKVRFGLCKQHQRRFNVRTRIGEITIPCTATADLQINHALIDIVQADKFAVDVQQIVERVRFLHLKFVQRPFEAFGMARKVDQLAAQNRRHLIDAISHQK